MKGKFSSMWRVVTALVLTLSLVLVMAALAMAAATAEFAPDNGPVGTVIAVTGTGWVASETITAVWVGNEAATHTLSVNEAGNLTGTITVPAGATVGLTYIEIIGSASSWQNFGSAFTVTTVTATPVPTVPPIPKPTPIDIAGSIGGDWIVTQDIVYSVLGGQAVLTIAKGTMALTAMGAPLQSISVTEVCFDLPPAPEGAYIIGCAYDYKPDGAIFNPPITLTLKYDPGKVPAGFDESKLVIAFYDTATSMWVVYPSVVDTVNHTITAQISHFTQFAVYAPGPTVTPTPTIAPTPTPTQTPAAGETNTWVIIGSIIAVIVIGLAMYLFLRKRRPHTR